MNTRFYKFCLRIIRWKSYDFPDVDKAILLVAPHTSIWDFVLGKIYFSSQGRRSTILIKKEAFFWPLGYFLKKMGGEPVDRGKRTGLTDKSIESFEKAAGRFYLVITPEGTRKKTKNWKKGFIRIAKSANVPVTLCIIDKSLRSLGFIGFLDMSGTDEQIMERMKRAYLGKIGINKDKFETGYE